MKNPKYIFVVGGVMSGVGKGISTASIAKILQSRGFEITAIKIDPYVNVDAGTMNPTEHGEVFVLDDGMECDQDMGNYERFLDKNLSGASYMTTGSVYLSVINKERSLGFKGKQVEVVPRVPMEVIDRIQKAAKKEKAEIVITEIGGTVGEYENLLFLEAIRLLKLKNPKDVVVVLVSFIPALGVGGTELKTKPTQHAVRNLNAVGIHPDIILGRASIPLDKKRKEKIQFMCSIDEGNVISAPDVESIYEVPVNFEKDNISDKILKKLSLRPREKDLKNWRRLVLSIRNSKKAVKIGIVGKYFGSGDFILTDSYISVMEAVKHAAYYWKRRPVVEWIDSEDFEKSPQKLKNLSGYNGIIIPGGFGSRGIEGKIKAINYLRTKKVPFLGLCYGMQMATIEFARNVAGLKNANTTEVNPETKNPVIDILPEQKKNLKDENFGATMRLGAYPAVLQKKTIAYEAYKNHLISERHRHRYEVNPDYIEKLQDRGLIFSGFSPNRRLMEILELPKSKHPFFVATQFHPEFKSRPLKPHPLFREFIKAAIKK
ncbi:CTP synthase [Candidatus Wolfebacteria bacterium]|nr:CTP synthase [Candidatus Wolfebacteria bacterium]